MRRTYLPNRKGSLFSRFPGGTGALLFALAVLALRLISPDTFWQLAAPVLRARDVLSAESRSLFNGFRNASELARENEELLRENAALLNQNNILLQKEADLSALLGSRMAEGIVAGVIARPPESPYDTLVLAAGLENGVTLGQTAFGEGDAPLGIVSSVRERFSRVTLFSAPGLQTSGWAGPAKIAVTLLGTGGGTLAASVPRSANLSPGDTISVPGPGRLPIGTIVAVDDEPSSPAAVLRIRMSANLFSTSWVLLRDSPSLP